MTTTEKVLSVMLFAPGEMMKVITKVLLGKKDAKFLAFLSPLLSWISSQTTIKSSQLIHAAVEAILGYEKTLNVRDIYQPEKGGNILKALWNFRPIMWVVIGLFLSFVLADLLSDTPLVPAAAIQYAALYVSIIGLAFLYVLQLDMHLILRPTFKTIIAILLFVSGMVFSVILASWRLLGLQVSELLTLKLVLLTLAAAVSFGLGIPWIARRVLIPQSEEYWRERVINAISLVVESIKLTIALDSTPILVISQFLNALINHDRFKDTAIPSLIADKFSEDLPYNKRT